MRQLLGFGLVLSSLLTTVALIRHYDISPEGFRAWYYANVVLIHTITGAVLLFFTGVALMGSPAKKAVEEKTKSKEE